jgi:hypothetical protein
MVMFCSVVGSLTTCSFVALALVAARYFAQPVRYCPVLNQSLHGFECRVDHWPYAVCPVRMSKTIT